MDPCPVEDSGSLPLWRECRLRTAAPAGKAAVLVNLSTFGEGGVQEVQVLRHHTGFVNVSEMPTYGFRCREKQSSSQRETKQRETEQLDLH